MDSWETQGRASLPGEWREGGMVLWVVVGAPFLLRNSVGIELTDESIGGLNQ